MGMTIDEYESSDLMAENEFLRKQLAEALKHSRMFEADYEARLKADKAVMLDKIRAEFVELRHYFPMGHDYQIAITRCLGVIAKYQAESEG